MALDQRQQRVEESRASDFQRNHQRNFGRNFQRNPDHGRAVLATLPGAGIAGAQEMSQEMPRELSRGMS